MCSNYMQTLQCNKWMTCVSLLVENLQKVKTFAKLYCFSDDIYQNTIENNRMNHTFNVCGTIFTVIMKNATYDNFDIVVTPDNTTKWLGCPGFCKADEIINVDSGNIIFSYTRATWTYTTTDNLSINCLKDYFICV